MSLPRKKIIKTGIILLSAGLLLVLIIAGLVIVKTWGRTLIQVDIHQNKKLIHLSTFAEPPQFAIWLENRETKELKTVFVTHRVAIGDWEGKANVPVALPQWFKLFRGDSKTGKVTGSAKRSDMAITGATPKEDYFSIRAEVKPGSEWICWIEMNLAGDFNDAFPEFDREAFREDEFSNGQPALLFKTEVRALEGQIFTPVITAQSIWENDIVRVEPVSEGITTAKDVFDKIQISVIRPKPKLIDKNKIGNI
jgi:hypothetical protein